MTVQLQIEVGIEPDADAAELDQATSRLRRELLELDVDDVTRPSAGEPPPGSRAVDAVLLSTLLVTAGSEAIATAVRTIAGWLGRRPNGRVKLAIGGDSIELTDVSATDQKRLLEAFLARHGNPGPDEDR